MGKALIAMKLFTTQKPIITGFQKNAAFKKQGVGDRDGQAFTKEKTQNCPLNEEIQARRWPRDCCWTSIWARSPCGKRLFNTYLNHTCDSFVTNYQCPALGWMNEQILVDKRHIELAAATSKIYRVCDFNFSTGKGTRCLKARLNYFPVVTAGLIKGVFLLLNPSLSFRGTAKVASEKSAPALFAWHTPLRRFPCWGRRAEVRLFFWTRFLVKPCSPTILKWISASADSISISQRVNFICWQNQEKSRWEEKITINSYSLRRDFTTGDRHLILFALTPHRGLFLPAPSPWLALQIEF